LLLHVRPALLLDEDHRGRAQVRGGTGRRRSRGARGRHGRDVEGVQGQGRGGVSGRVSRAALFTHSTRRVVRRGGPFVCSQRPIAATRRALSKRPSAQVQGRSPCFTFRTSAPSPPTHT